jgi:chemotaxis protein CheD
MAQQVQAKPALALPLGATDITRVASAVYAVSNVSSSLIVVLYDKVNKIAALAHIVLPDSKLQASGFASTSEESSMTAKFADLALPVLTQQFEAKGGQKPTSTARLVGGAQLFNFNSGAGNPLNVGYRNAIAARTLLTRLGYRVDKADIGGNKGRNVRFEMTDSKIFVNLIGGREYLL